MNQKLKIFFIFAGVMAFLMIGLTTLPESVKHSSAQSSATGCPELLTFTNSWENPNFPNVRTLKYYIDPGFTSGIKSQIRNGFSKWTTSLLLMPCINLRFEETSNVATNDIKVTKDNKC